MSSETISPTGIPIAPSPWTLSATIYMFAWYIPSSQPLPPFAYSPLEAKSAVLISSKPCGGLASVQVIRYSDSPVGPYDEMLVCPGTFEYEVVDNGQKVVRKNTRVSRIYVSQKVTCYNGRKTWNIPKHLARFSFTSPTPDTTKVEVFPHDTTGDILEATASAKPFFTALYKPISYMPSFPFSTRIGKYMGIDFNLVQPPLPEGKGKEGELPGTTKWCKLLPLEYTKKASLGWFDLRQMDPSGDSKASNTDDLDEDTLPEGAYSTFENWWPGLRRWNIGLKMEDATVDFGGEIYWE
ncbi:hypothetical protein MMC30_009157 [Trapelia coarctata]|nr:hypothetical protein [Trapelia coarctata]